MSDLNNGTNNSLGAPFDTALDFVAGNIASVGGNNISAMDKDIYSWFLMNGDLFGGADIFDTNVGFPSSTVSSSSSSANHHPSTGSSSFTQALSLTTASSTGLDVNHFMPPLDTGFVLPSSSSTNPAPSHLHHHRPRSNSNSSHGSHSSHQQLASSLSSGPLSPKIIPSNQRTGTYNITASPLHSNFLSPGTLLSSSSGTHNSTNLPPSSITLASTSSMPSTLTVPPSSSTSTASEGLFSSAWSAAASRFSKFLGMEKSNTAVPSKPVLDTVGIDTTNHLKSICTPSNDNGMDNLSSYLDAQNMDIEPPDLPGTNNNKNTRRSGRKRGLDPAENTTNNDNYSVLKGNNGIDDDSTNNGTTGSKRAKGTTKAVITKPSITAHPVPGSAHNSTAPSSSLSSSTTTPSNNSSNTMSKPRFDLSTLLQNFGDPTKQNRGNATLGNGTKASPPTIPENNTVSAATVSSTRNSKRNIRTTNDVPLHSTATKSGSHISSGVATNPSASFASHAIHQALSQPPFPIPASLQALATTDRNVAELLSSMDTVYSENAALREQLRRMDIEMPSTVNHNAARDVERVEQLQKIVSMVHENAPEAQLRRAILGYKDMWADFGKDRWTALRYHLRMLKLLLLPNQITRMCMWSIGGDETGATMTPTSVASNVSNNGSAQPSSSASTSSSSVPINSTAATITSSLRPAITTWQQISAACEITEEQGTRILSLRDSIRSRRREFAEMLQNLKLLEDRVASNFQGLEFQMNLLMSHLSPRQLALFLDWMERNHVIFNLISSLSAWPQPQSAVVPNPNVTGNPNHTESSVPSDTNRSTVNSTAGTVKNDSTVDNESKQRNNRKGRPTANSKGKKDTVAPSTDTTVENRSCTTETGVSTASAAKEKEDEEEEEEENELQGYPFPFTHSSFLSRMLGGGSSSTQNEGKE